MAEAKNTFLKGRMNQDLDSRILPEGEYREAINLLISRSEGNTVGEFENVLGNTQIPSNETIFSGGKVIGHVVDETNNRGFFLITDFSKESLVERAPSNSKCAVVEISFDAPYTIKVLVTGAWLNFNQCYPVTGINLLENLLFWTDNLNQPRKINIDLANPSSLATPNYYTEESQISVAKYYPFQPLIPLHRLTVNINTGSSNTTTIVTTSEQPNIQVGDLLTDHDKSAGVQEQITYPVRVSKINSLTSFEIFPALSSNLTISKVDFSRTTMENKYEEYESNYSLNNQVNGTGSNTIQITSANYGGLPRIGDIVKAGSTTVGGTANTALNKIGGNLVGPLTNSITQNTTNATAATYNLTVPSGSNVTTSGNGTGATIQAVVTGTTVSSITVTAAGYGFQANETITISAGQLGTNSTALVITLKQQNITETRISGFTLGISSGISATNQEPYIWNITLDHPHGMSGGQPSVSTDWVDIAVNPDYDINFKGDSKFLEDKFVRFSYRFNFIDGEESLIAPFSQIMFIPKQYGLFGAGQLTSTVTQTAPSPDLIYPDYNQDSDDAYKSTIIQWFENDTDSVSLKIPTPTSTPGLLQKDFLIQSVDILYKESDQLAIKVLDTLDINNITSFTQISYNDVVNGIVDQSYIDYQYKSTKPYKTLTEGDTTRVYDKVPIRALGQEVIGNRIVYGNYVENMTPPESIPYSVSTGDRTVVWDNYVEYPYHNLKQNRTYQVGFVLCDYYGRQSSVVLSSYDDDNERAGSSIYLPYRTLGDATSSPVIDWLGKALSVTINSSIGDETTAGIYKAEDHVASVLAITDGDSGYVAGRTYKTSGGSGTGCTVIVTSVNAGAITGIQIMTSGKGYTQGNELTVLGGGGSGSFTVNVGDANPLGWYSYKIVVKQQEQDYYNVFVPGFINGLPVWQNPVDGGLERNKFSLTTVTGENVNKIPRSLNEVGPTDREFNSDEILYIRVTNKDAVITEASNVTTSISQYTGSAIPWNSQYYPGQLSQNVLNISTMRETEFGAIPFVAFINNSSQQGRRGEYNSTISTVTGGNVTTTEPTGSIPWGDVGKVASFYLQEENPFVIKFNTSSNNNNQVGANVNENIAWDGGQFTAGTPDNFAMQPFLGIVETKPVSSALELYYETSMSGLLEVLNAGINQGNPSVVSSTQSSFTFPESTSAGAVIGSLFRFKDGEGATITNATGLTVSISKVVRQSAPNSPIVDANGDPDLFALTGPSGTAEYQFKTDSNATFYYGPSSDSSNNSTDVYTITLTCTRDVGGEIYQTTVDTVASLTNVTPAVTTSNLSTADPKCNCPGGSPCPISITSATTNIKQFYGNNGSANTAKKTDDLVWSLGTITASDGSSTTGLFNIDAASGLLTRVGSLVDNITYNVTVKLTDVAGAGITVDCITVLQVGYQYSPKGICAAADLSTNSNINYRLIGKPSGGGNNNIEYLFAATNSQALGAGGCCYPSGVPAYGTNNSPTKLVNMGVINTTGSFCRSDLYQGTLKIKGHFEGLDASCTGSAAITWHVQYRANPQSSWGPPPSNANFTGPSYPTAGVSLSISGGGDSDVSSFYYFDAIGEYRVVTTNITGEFGTGSCADKVQFYIEYGDGYYNNCAQSPCAT